MIAPHEVAITDDASAIEREFLEALARLVANEPRNRKLDEAAKKGRIKPSQVKVALEAGHSRTLISGTPSAYPRVQVEIERAIEWFQRSRRPITALAKLDDFAEKRALRLEVRQAIEKRESMKRQRDASYTSEAASVILAQAMDRHAKIKDGDVTAIRRRAEQRVLTRRGTLGS